MMTVVSITITVVITVVVVVTDVSTSINIHHIYTTTHINIPMHHGGGRDNGRYGGGNVVGGGIIIHSGTHPRGGITMYPILMVVMLVGW